MIEKIKLKHMTALFIAVLMMICFGLSAVVMPPKVSAGENIVNLTLDQNVKGQKGQEVKVNVTMDSMTQPCANVQYLIKYDDSRIEYVNNSGTVDSNYWEGGVNQYPGTTDTLIAYVNSKSGLDETINKSIMTFTFKIKEKAPAGIAVVDFAVDDSNPDVSANNDGAIPYEFNNGSVLVVSPITKVTLNKDKLSLTAGDSDTLTATVDPADTTDDKTIKWSTGNDKIATVDQAGKVTAVSAGTTDITATTTNGKTAKCSVTVSPMGTTVAQAPTATGITYGQQLGESTLSGGSVKGADNAEVKGSWQFKNTDGVLAAGTQTAKAVFTPSEPGRYSQCETDVSVDVAKLTVTVTPQALEEGKVLGKTYGEKDGELTYSCEPALVGSDAFTGALAREAGEDAGTYPINLGTLSAGENYTLKLAEDSVYTINKALPTFDPAPQVKDPVDKGTKLEDIKYTDGKALDIDGKELKGTFEWADPSVKVDKNGNYKMRFTPEDPNYAVMLIDVTVKVKGDDTPVPSPGAPQPETPQPHVTGGNPNTGILNNPAVLYPMAALMLVAVCGCTGLYIKRVKAGKH